MYGELVAQANLISQVSRKCKARSRQLKLKAKTVRARRLRASNSNLAMYLEGLAMILEKVSRMDSSNPWYKSAGDGKRIDNPKRYVLRCNQLMKLRMSDMKSLVDKWLEIEPNVAARFIPKVGEQSGLRPLGVPGHMSKALETILTPFVDSCMVDKVNDIGYYGYKRGHSCHKAIKDLRSQWSSGNYQYAIMLDQSGAFNSLTPEAKQMAYKMLPKWCQGMVEKFTERPQFKDIREASWQKIDYKAQLEQINTELAKLEIWGNNPHANKLRQPLQREAQLLQETIAQGTHSQYVVWYTGSKSMGYSTHYIKKYKDGSPVIETIKGLHGTPQGGVLSPRIYMIAQSIAYRKISGIAGVVYADDAVILTNRDPQEVIQELTIEFAKLGLRINPDKSDISETHAKLLGWSVSKDGITELDAKMYLGRSGRNKDGINPTEFDLVIKEAIESYAIGIEMGETPIKAAKLFTIRFNCFNKEIHRKCAWGKFKYYANGIAPITLKDLGLELSEDTNNDILQSPFGKKLLEDADKKPNASKQLTSEKLAQSPISDWLIV